MTDMSPSAEPVRLLPNRVYRFYRGGALIDRLRGDNQVDGSFPEDWIGSVTPANNPGREDVDEGLSRLADGRLLRDAIAVDPELWLGSGRPRHWGLSTGLLVKLLDSAQRLPIHAHPNRRFAEAHLRSPFGKTEAWIVLATRRPSGEVWVGLREPVAPGRWRGWIDDQDVVAMLDALHNVSVVAGDIVFVPAGVPHAIGRGILIAELQEPTDFSLICEWDGFPIRPEDSHLGLGWDLAFDALDLTPQPPIMTLPASARSFFWADEELTAPGRFAVLLVLEGDATINGQRAAPGDAFALPASLTELRVESHVRVLRILSPTLQAND